MLGDLAQVVPVDGDPARGGVVEARHQLGQGRLAGAGRAHQRDRLSRRHLQVDAVQDVVASAVGEVHALEVDLPPQSFDVVLMTDVLEHIEDDHASARAALRLLRPGGIVVATVPAYQWLYSPRDTHHHHFRRYSRDRFKSLWASRDAAPVLLSHYNTLLFAPAAAARIATKLTPHRKPGDLSVPPRAINELLARVMSRERSALGRLPLPFGLSLVAVVRKEANANDVQSD